MKTLFTIQLLYCLGISLCSCPYVSPYTLDDNPNISIEDSLLGKWATVVKKFESEKEIPVKLIISRKTDLEYNIAITGDLDDDKLNAWLRELLMQEGPDIFRMKQA